MEDYTFLRALADSWGLLVMTVFFLAVCAFAFRPGSREGQDEIAGVVFRNDRLPAAPEAERQEGAQ